VDSGQVEYLYGRLLKAQPQEVIVIREALFDHQQDLTERLWILLGNPQQDQDQRLRAACALAAFAPDNPRWEKVSGDVAAALVAQKPFGIAQWIDALKGAGKWLLPTLADFLVDEKRSVSERGLAVRIRPGSARASSCSAIPGLPWSDGRAFSRMALYGTGRSSRLGRSSP
jgi:hypothetical protein